MTNREPITISHPTADFLFADPVLGLSAEQAVRAAELIERIKVPLVVASALTELQAENDRLRKDLRKLLATASDRIARLERENSKLRSLVPPTIDPLANAQKIIDECLVNDPDFVRLSGCVKQWKIRESELKQRATTAEARIAELTAEVDKSDQRLEQLERDSGCKARPMVSE